MGPTWNPLVLLPLGLKEAIVACVSRPMYTIPFLQKLKVLGSNMLIPFPWLPVPPVASRGGHVPLS